MPYFLELPQSDMGVFPTLVKSVARLDQGKRLLTLGETVDRCLDYRRYESMQ